MVNYIYVFYNMSVPSSHHWSVAVEVRLSKWLVLYHNTIPTYFGSPVKSTWNGRWWTAQSVFKVATISNTHLSSRNYFTVHLYNSTNVQLYRYHFAFLFIEIFFLFTFQEIWFSQDIEYSVCFSWEEETPAKSPRYRYNNINF